MQTRIIALAALALALSGGVASAQPKKAELEAAKKEAIAIADKGVEAFRGEKYQDAIDAFKKADQKFHVPKFALYVARAQAKLGKLLDAKATYQAIADEKLAQYAPDEFFSAQNDAKKELADLDKRIPTVRIEVNGVPAGQTVAVTLDGAALAATDLGKPLARDPGPHVIVVTLAGRAPLTRNVDLRESGSDSVVLEMGVAPLPVPTATATATAAPTVTATLHATATQASTATGAPTSAPVPVARGGGPNVGVLATAYGVGIVGVAVGAIFGGLTIGKYNEFNATPSGTKKQLTDAADQGETFALVADVGLFVGIPAMAAGTIYWIVTAARRGPATPAAPAKTGWFVAPAVGTSSGGVSVTGHF